MQNYTVKLNSEIDIEKWISYCHKNDHKNINDDHEKSIKPQKINTIPLTVYNKTDITIINDYKQFISSEHKDSLQWYLIVFYPCDKAYETDPNWFNTKGIDACRKKLTDCESYFITKKINGTTIYISALVLANQPLDNFSGKIFYHKYHIHSTQCTYPITILKYITKEFEFKIPILFTDYVYKINSRKMKDDTCQLKNDSKLIYNPYLFLIDQIHIHEKTLTADVMDTNLYLLQQTFKNRNKYKKNILFIDTETTGFPSGSCYNSSDHMYSDNSLFKNSRMIQISWKLCENINKLSTHKIKSKYIKSDIKYINNSYIHGISMNTLNEKGKSLIGILKKGLSKAIMNANVIIAHNINFDIAILLNELYRINKTDEINKILHLKQSQKLICSMKLLKNIINAKNKNGHVKQPNLSECYYYYFNKDFNNKHNAKYDVKALIKIIKKFCKTSYLLQPTIQSIKPWTFYASGITAQYVYVAKNSLKEGYAVIKFHNTNYKCKTLFSQCSKNDVVNTIISTT
jgi:DNA polymerase III epsilon subunit-like protein